MLLSEFITLTKDGSLHQVAISQESIIAYTNLGIQTLSDEFDLLSKTTYITLSANTTEYELPIDFESVYSITTPGLYWRDLKGLLTKKIDTDFEVGVNVEGDYNSIFIPNKDLLVAPFPIEGQILTLEYKAVPVPLIEVTETLPIANQYFTSLMLYVTYMGYLSSLGSSHADTSAAIKMYKDSVNVLNNNGTYINTYGFNSKFTTRGFV